MRYDISDLDDEVGEGVRDDSEDFDGAALGVDEGFHHRSCQVFQHVWGGERAVTIWSVNLQTS